LIFSLLKRLHDYNDYNNNHPHASIGNNTPIEFKMKRSA